MAEEIDVVVNTNETSGSVGYVLRDQAGALAAYPHARRVGETLYVSGVSSRRPDNSYEGVEVHADGTWTLDVYEQTAAVLRNIARIVRAAGGRGLANLVDSTCFLVDMGDYKEFNRAWNDAFEAALGADFAALGPARSFFPSQAVFGRD